MVSSRVSATLGVRRPGDLFRALNPNIIVCGFATSADPLKVLRRKMRSMGPHGGSGDELQWGRVGSSGGVPGDLSKGVMGGSGDLPPELHCLGIISKRYYLGGKGLLGGCLGSSP